MSSLMSRQTDAHGGLIGEKVMGNSAAETRDEKPSLKTQQLEEIFGEELDGPPCRKECCSMCGDVGFAEQLLCCSVCHERVEHKYCSTSYWESDSNEASWMCDWCWPSVKAAALNSESDREESLKVNGQELHRNWSSSSEPRLQNGLDLLLEVAWAQDLPAPMAKGNEQDAVTSSSTGAIAVLEPSSSRKPSSNGKRRQVVGPDRWSVTQKRGCSRNYETICAQSGIQLERANLAKGLGRRYRLLSSMLC